MSVETKKSAFSIKVFLIATLIVVVAGALGVIAYFITQNHRQVQRLNEANAAFDNEDWVLAETKLAESYQEDTNNEEVVTKLAKVNEQLGNWSEAGFLWSRAYDLNAFKAAYLENSLEAYFRANSSNALLEKLTAMQPLESNHHKLLMTLALAQTDSVESARIFIEKVKDLEALATPLGRLLSVYLDEDPELTTDEKDQLTAVAESSEPAVALYALASLASDAMLNDQIDSAEAYLKRRIPLNPKLGRLDLAQFYYVQGEALESVKLYRKMIDTLSPIDSIRFAEALSALNLFDELALLKERYRVGSRADITTGYYIDALIAYQNKDWDTLSSRMEAIGNELPTTPIAEMLAIQKAVIQKDVTTTLELLEQIPFDQNRRFDDYETILLPFVLELLSENDLESAANISSILKKRDYDNFNYTLAIITNAAQRRSLSKNQLESVLAKYPNEARLLSIAADFYLRIGDFPTAKKMAEKLLQLDSENITAQLLLIGSLESMRQIDAATKSFKTLYSANPNNQSLLIQYLAFCTRNKLFNELESLASSLSEESDSQALLYRLLAEAEIAQLRDERTEAHSLLMQIVNKPDLQIDQTNAAILFRTANILGSFSYLDPAIQLYNQLLALSPNAVPILVNLSELYAEKAESDPYSIAFQKAINLASQAYALDDASPITRECYAQRLYENKQYSEAEKLLFDSIYGDNVSPRSRTIWKNSMEQIIKEAAILGNRQDLIAACNSLLRAFPKNEIAEQYLLDATRNSAEATTEPLPNTTNASP